VSCHSEAKRMLTTSTTCISLDTCLGRMPSNLDNNHPASFTMTMRPQIHPLNHLCHYSWCFLALPLVRCSARALVLCAFAANAAPRVHRYTGLQHLGEGEAVRGDELEPCEGMLWVARWIHEAVPDARVQLRFDPGSCPAGGAC
jgi:hypothetical protein